MNIRVEIYEREDGWGLCQTPHFADVATATKYATHNWNPLFYATRVVDDDLRRGENGHVLHVVREPTIRETMRVTDYEDLMEELAKKLEVDLSDPHALLALNLMVAP